MIRLFAPIVALLALTTVLSAQCRGQDLRDTLTPAEASELASELAVTPFPAGNRWRAERDGKTLHLVGTVHVDDPRLAQPLTRLRPVLETAGVVLLETTSQERSALFGTLSARTDLLVMPDATLPELLGEAVWQQLAEAMRARGVPPVMAAKFQPWYVATLLAIPPCLQAALAEENGFDMQIETLATDADVPVRALEGFDTGLRAFADMPRDMQLTMMQTAIVAPGAAEDQFETLMASYFDERHAESWILSGLLAARLSPLADAEADLAMQALSDALLDTRNRAWIPVIEDALADARAPVVAAFGAAHLHGDAGVLALLQDRGFVLTREAF